MTDTKTLIERLRQYARVRWAPTVTEAADRLESQEKRITELRKQVEFLVNHREEIRTEAEKRIAELEAQNIELKQAYTEQAQLRDRLADENAALHARIAELEARPACACPEH